MCGPDGIAFSRSVNPRPCFQTISPAWATPMAREGMSGERWVEWRREARALKEGGIRAQ